MMNKIADPNSYYDIQGLDSLRQKAQKDEKGALEEVAKQFESMFTGMLIKSMRQANEAFETESPFNNRHTKFYQQMYDQQLAMDMSQQGSLGLADALIRQLDPGSQYQKAKPAEELQMPGHKVQTTQLPAVSQSDQAPSQKEQQGRAVSEPQPSEKVARKPAAKFAAAEEFINQLMPYAEKAGKELGVNPVVLVAQAALETGWGKKILNTVQNESSFNLFNIKADRRWQGDKVNVTTLEVENGVGVKTKADFRVYQDFNKSFDDYVAFISHGKRYQEAMKHADNPERYVEELQKAGYATDPAYADKIKQIMKSDKFAEYANTGRRGG